MDLSVRNSRMSFGALYSSYGPKFSAKLGEVTEQLKDVTTRVVFDGKDVKIFDDVNDNVYKLLSYKPEYAYQSGRKVIQYPVLLNGVETVYSVSYKFPQTNINGIGYELFSARGIDRKLIAAREIAKDIAAHTNAQQKTIAIA